MDLEGLTQYLRRGGAAVLEHPATYAVADGAVVAPARYAGRNGSEFVYEVRSLDGAFVTTALIDSKQSQSNRAEEGLLAARRDGGAATKIPVIEVSYEGRESLYDLSLPHRAFDAHVRFSSQDGEPAVRRGWYRALRDATHADLSPLFTTSPASLGFGSWDSTRKSGQLRLRGLVVSELYGVVADSDRRLSRRSGARLDPLGQDMHLSPDEFLVALEGQREEMSPETFERRVKEAETARRKGQTLSASVLGLGGVPPQTEPPYGVSVPEVRRSRTYSLAGLRRLRFGGTSDEDVAARATLLAMLLLGMAYADADPDIRAYCDVSAPRDATLLDGESVDLDLSIEACEAFLASTIDRLPERLTWTGQVQRLIGDPALNRGAVDTDGATE